MILSHNIHKKKGLLNFKELIKTLKDEQLSLSNENRGITNYVHRFKR